MARMIIKKPAPQPQTKKKSGGSSTRSNNNNNAPKYHKITISGTRGATISVNGSQISDKVPHTLTNGPTGRYVFTITKDGYYSKTKTVNTTVLGVYTVNANLTKKPEPAPEPEPETIPSGGKAGNMNTGTPEQLTKSLNEILSDDEDEPEAGSYTGDNLGNIGFGSDGVSPGAVIEEGVGEVDVEKAEEIAKSSPVIKRVVKITEIVNDDTLTEEEKYTLLDCYNVDDGGSKKTVQETRPILVQSKKDEGGGSSNLKTGKLNPGAAAKLNQKSVYKLIDRNSEESYGSTLGEGYADFDMKYNYVSYEFEDYVLAETPPVSRLPSFANFINLGKEDVPGVNDQSVGSLTYPPRTDGTEMLPKPPRTYFGTLLTRPENHEFSGYRLEYRSAGSVSIYYYDLFSSMQVSDTNYANLEHLNKNYVFHEPFLTQAREKNYLKKHFPVYVNIELSSYKPVGTDGYFVDVLKKNNMQGVFMNNIMARALEVPSEVAEDQEGKLVKYWRDIPIDSNSLLQSPYTSDNSIHFYGPQKEESSLDAGAYNASLKMFPEPRTSITETIMFKVSKYLKGSEEPIQNFFFFNDSKAGPIEFVDTQLNIAESYEYRVFSYDIYKYGLGTSTIELVEYETFHQDDVYIVSKPPMPPDVTIAPYMGNESDMLFLFNDSSGKVLLEPIALDDSDIDRLGKIRKIYGKRVPDPNMTAEEFETALESEKFKNLIEYEYDGSSIFFEAYRTTEPPRSYEDFAGKRIARTIGTSFKDKLSPNTKYYYTFRCMDNHGNFSNPSAVFEVEIVKTFNVFPNIRVYEFPDVVKETREVKRSMKRFLRITPDTKFMLVRDAGGNPEYTLGANNIIDPLWNKKFKLRMTSKTTGKKIDFNFSFTKSFIGNT